MSESHGPFPSLGVQWKLQCESLAEVAGDRRFLGTAEFRALPKFLGRDESILAITNGEWRSATPLLVLTDRRILMLERKCDIIPAGAGVLPAYRIKQRSVSLNDAEGVLAATCGISRGSLTVQDGETEWCFWDVPNETIMRFMEAFNRALDSVGVRPAKPSMSNFSARLRLLDGLRAQGLLTDEEFVRLQQRASL